MSYDLIEWPRDRADELWKLNYSAWGKSLTPEQYLARENMLSDQPLTRERGIIFWALVDSDDRDIPLSACETLRKRGILRKEDGKVVQVDGWGVASVFTMERQRGQGYASRMMRMLRDKLKDMSADFSVLWSDVGLFYSSIGWKPYPTATMTLPASTVGDIGDIEWIKQGDRRLKELCEADAEMVSSELELGAFELIPRYEEVQWHLARASVYEKQLDHVAIRAGDGWMIWNVDIHADVLQILRLREPSTVILLEKLFAAAAKVASLIGVSNVQLWDPQVMTRELAARHLWSIHDRADSVPCILWLHDDTDVTWHKLDKVSWC